MNHVLLLFLYTPSLLLSWRGRLCLPPTYISFCPWRSDKSTTKARRDIPVFKKIEAQVRKERISRHIVEKETRRSKQAGRLIFNVECVLNIFRFVLASCSFLYILNPWGISTVLLPVEWAVCTVTDDSNNTTYSAVRRCTNAKRPY